MTFFNDDLMTLFDTWLDGFLAVRESMACPVCGDGEGVLALHADDDAPCPVCGEECEEVY